MVAFSFPGALCLPVALWFLALRVFPLVRDNTDGWYSLNDTAGADDDGVPSSTASSSSRAPLLLVIVDDIVDARLGALRLGGSERISASA
ncbi:unnamed protein product [Penicillium glandicola]